MVGGLRVLCKMSCQIWWACGLLDQRFWILFISRLIPLEGEQFLTAFSFGGWSGSAWLGMWCSGKVHSSVGSIWIYIRLALERWSSLLAGLLGSCRQPQSRNELHNCILIFRKQNISKYSLIEYSLLQEKKWIAELFWFGASRQMSRQRDSCSYLLCTRF